MTALGCPSVAFPPPKWFLLFIKYVRSLVLVISLHIPLFLGQLFSWLFMPFFASPTLPLPSKILLTPHVIYFNGDVQFLPPGPHLHLKWAKNLQAPEKHHNVKLPRVNDPTMCSVQTLTQLFRLLPSQPSTPLFSFPSGLLLTESMLRHRLTSILNIIQCPLQGVGFHTFRRSAATIAFEAKVPIPILQMHGAWHSDAIWNYISQNTSQSLHVPLTFQALVNVLP